SGPLHRIRHPVPRSLDERNENARRRVDPARRAGNRCPLRHHSRGAPRPPEKYRRGSTVVTSRPSTEPRSSPNRVGPPSVKSIVWFGLKRENNRRSPPISAPKATPTSTSTACC